MKLNKYNILINIAVRIIILLAKTWRIEVKNILPSNKGIVIFWHGNMLPAWFIFSKTNSFSVVSLSKDGEVLTRILTNWKYNVLRGSSSRNKKEVFNEIIDSANKGLVLITPDGPQGPCNKLKAGALVASARTNVPLYYLKINILSSIKFSSWDKFELPLPFSKIIIEISNPIYFDNDSKELINKELTRIEGEMN